MKYLPPHMSWTGRQLPPSGEAVYRLGGDDVTQHQTRRIGGFVAAFAALVSLGAGCDSDVVCADCEACSEDADCETAECDADCTSATCGDGHVNALAGEACDDGNTNDHDECTNACTLPVCGDGIVGPGEPCDDGNSDPSDGCDNACLMTPIPQIAARGSHTCALDSGGKLGCWGKDNFGQATVPDALGTVARIAAGEVATCALSNVGDVTCWGYLPYDIPPTLEKASQVVVGRVHACALAAGVVTCWGDNMTGQTDVPASLGPVAQIAASEGQTCALDETGLSRVGVGTGAVRRWSRRRWEPSFRSLRA
jgi:cysteine-rich repeat protein